MGITAQDDGANGAKDEPSDATPAPAEKPLKIDLPFEDAVRGLFKVKRDDAKGRPGKD